MVLVAPIQSLRSHLSTSPLPSSHALGISCHTIASGRTPPFPGAVSQCCVWRLRNKRQYRYSFYLFSNREVESDEDFDEIIDELFQESASVSTPAANEGETDVAIETEKKGGNSSHFIEGQTTIGIGGNDGFVYDVNALKRNLVQESVRGCKQELLVLLGDGSQDEAIAQRFKGKEEVVVPPRWRRDRDDLIEERLSALVQANPVSTTTDSNLLDGEWSFAFTTNSASTILDTSRFLLSKTKRTDPPASQNVGANRPWRFRAGKTDNPFRSSTREIYLENLDSDENAHVVDETRVLGGLFQISRRYDVFGLTRTALDLDLMERESKLFGFRVNGKSRDDFKGTKQGQPLEIQVLYLDTDLCICTTGVGLDGPLHVYTKNVLWVNGGTKRKVRLIAKMASWLSSMQSPLRIRQRLINVFTRNNEIGPAKVGQSIKAVNIGEFDINEDGTTREDSAWDGPDDPFLHLSPNERMEVLRTMSLQDIYQSALERKEQNKKQKKKKWVGSKDKKFKRPDL